MNATLRRRFEMAARVRDFLRAHKTEEGAEAATLARLEELLQRADALAAQQRAGVLARRAAAGQRQEVRRALQTRMLRYLARVGAAAATEDAQLAAQFQLQRTPTSHQAVLTMARGMLDKALAQKELLLRRGLSEKLLADLTAAVTEFEQTLESSRASLREHVGASAELESVAHEVLEQVRLLDSLVRYRFGDNAELMGAWASAHNVAGPFRSRTEPAGGGETPGTEKAA